MSEKNSERARRAPSRTMLRRTLFLLSVCGIAAFAVLILRLGKLQIVDHERYEQAAVEQQLRGAPISAARGTNVHRRTAELGYYVAEPYWGRGLCTAAVKAACAHVFAHSDILRIYAEPFAHNAASCRVLEKAGFVYEGTLRANAVKNGAVCDMRMYALVREG